MSPELRVVIEFCLEHAPQAPVHKRILLYRGLAEFCGVPDDAAHFRNLANLLEQADRECREFAFEIINRPGKTNNE